MVAGETKLLERDAIDFRNRRRLLGKCQKVADVAIIPCGKNIRRIRTWQLVMTAAAWIDGRVRPATGVLTQV